MTIVHSSADGDNRFGPRTSLTFALEAAPRAPMTAPVLNARIGRVHPRPQVARAAAQAPAATSAPAAGRCLRWLPAILFVGARLLARGTPRAAGR